MKQKYFILFDGSLLVICMLLLSMAFTNKWLPLPILDRVGVSCCGVVTLNGKEVDKFGWDEVKYEDSVAIARRLHHLFRNQAQANQVEVQVDGKAQVGWNNRIVDVVYGIVEYELTPWKSMRYRVDEEDPTPVDIGLYFRARQLTVAYADPDEMKAGMVPPFLSLERFYRRVLEAEHTMKNRELCAVALGGESELLLQRRAEYREIVGPMAQVGFEQKLRAEPEWAPLNDVMKISFNRCERISLDEAGVVRWNGEEIAGFAGDPNDYFGKRHLKNRVDHLLKDPLCKPVLVFQVDRDAIGGWFEQLFMWIYFARDSHKVAWSEIVIQFDDGPYQYLNFDRGLGNPLVRYRCRLSRTGRIALMAPGPSCTRTIHYGSELCSFGELENSMTLREMKTELQEVFGPQIEPGIPQLLRVH